MIIFIMHKRAQTILYQSVLFFYELLPWHCSREVGSAYVCMNITHFALCTNDYYHAQTCINDSLSIGIVFITFFVHGTARVKLAVQTYIYFIPLDLPRTIVYTRIWYTSDAQSIGKHKSNNVNVALLTSHIFIATVLHDRLGIYRVVILNGPPFDPRKLYSWQ